MNFTFLLLNSFLDRTKNNLKLFKYLFSAFFLILLSVHGIIFILMQKATIEEAEGTNEGKSLLNKAKPVQINETNNKQLSSNP